MKRLKWKHVLLAVLVCLFTAGSFRAMASQDSVSSGGLVEKTETAALYQFGSLEAVHGVSQYSAGTDGILEAMYQSLYEVEDSLDISEYQITVEQVKSFFSNVVNSHPELFYVSNTYRVSYYSTSGIAVSIQWNYTEDDKTVIDQMKANLEAASASIERLISPEMTEIEKAMVIHEALILKIDYSNTTSWANGSGCYTAYCALVEGKAVCQGYALAFNLLAEREGVESEFVASDALNHAWNSVRIGDFSYHVDCTWDDGQQGAGSIQHRNFMLSDTGIRSTGHSRWNDSSINGKDDSYDDYYWREPEYDQVFLKNGTKWYLLPPDAGGMSNLKSAVIIGKEAVLTGLAENVERTVRFPLEQIVSIGQDFLKPCSEEEAEPEVIPVPSVRYQTHVQSHGWQEWRMSGDVSGTSGEAKRLEAIRIQETEIEDVGVQYRVHCQSYGWMKWVSDGAMAGTSGEAKRLEAVQIQLTGEKAGDYDIYYRVHAQSYGWLGWAKNGAPAGSEGQAKRLEAVQIVIVPRGDSAPGSVENAFYPASVHVSYTVHCQSYGWLGRSMDGEVSGTFGQAKRLEAIRIDLMNTSAQGHIVYRTHVQSYGWQNWRQDGEISGTSGQAKRLEAIQIQLTEDMASQYDVYYRVHSQTYGWLGWAKNGEPAGTEGQAKRLEAVEIILAQKNGEAPKQEGTAFIR